MGLLDSIASSVLGHVGGEKGALMQTAMDTLNENGGLNGMLEKFRENGLASEAASWIGLGENMSISAEQIQSVLGSGAVAGMAAKLGIDSADLSEKLAVYLPQVVDKLTPDGEVPEDESGLMSQMMDMFKN